MKCFFAVLLSLSTLIACQEKSVEDTSSDHQANTTPFEITNLTVTSTDCGIEEETEATLTVSVESDIVQIEHRDFTASSCLGFEVEGGLEGTDLTLSYIETGEPCDCISAYTLIYDIQGLDAGTYSMTFPGNLSEDVTID